MSKLSINEIEKGVFPLSSKRIIGTIDFIEFRDIIPSKEEIEKLASKYNCQFLVRIYKDYKSIIFYKNLDKNVEEAIFLYDKYMNNILNKEEHIKLGMYFGYSLSDVKAFVYDLFGDENKKIRTFYTSKFNLLKKEAENKNLTSEEYFKFLFKKWQEDPEKYNEEFIEPETKREIETQKYRESFYKYLPDFFKMIKSKSPEYLKILKKIL